MGNLKKRTRPTRVCIVGCGRWLRRDDQAGLVAAQRLEEGNSLAAEIILTESPGADTLTHLAGSDLLIVVDAAEPDERHPPGAWRRIDYRAAPHRLRTRSCCSTHTMGLGLALRLAERLNELPERVWVYAIAIASVGYGEQISSPVARAISEVVANIRRVIAESVGPRPAAGDGRPPAALGARKARRKG